MKDAFFTSASSASKRKRPSGGNSKRSSSTTGRSSSKSSIAPTTSANNRRHQQHSSNDDDDDVDLDDEKGPSNIDDMNLEASEGESSEEELEETAAEKRVRLAKAYLNKIQDDLDDDFAGGFDAADLDRDLLAERLRHDDDEAVGKLHRRVADKFDFTALNESTTIHSKRGHQLAVTAVALTDNGLYYYSGSKDGSIIKWDAKTMDKLHVYPGGRKQVKDYIGHTDQVYCLATSADNQYLASGGKDKIINIWSIKDNQHLATFTQHRDAVSGLAFRKGSNQLYSASHDRTIKVWNIDERSYIETLFGHQDQITAIDTLGRERCVSTGGRDKTTRLWKIVEESQLVYRGGASTKNRNNESNSNKPIYVEGSLDSLAQIDESTFVTGGDSGVISLWDINRKKPVFSMDQSHGISTFDNNDQPAIKTPYWITALASLKYSDLFVSGSWDGMVRFWKLAADNKSFSQVGHLAVQGCINSLQIKTISPGNRTYLVIGVGQELRLGRWLRLKDGAKNGSKLVELPLIKKK